MTRSFAGLGAAVVALACSLAACTENTGSTVNSSNEAPVQRGAAALVNDAVGPAAEVPNATTGGTVTILMLDDFEHLDPAQSYVNTQQVTAQLIYRTLTTFREHPDGRFEVVGDLATNTGVTPDSGKTWTFTLRPGVTYEDGRPVRAQDVAYGIARSFSPQLPNGPHYLQQWLADDADYNRRYKGPYNGGSDLPPNVETPDDRTIVFHFPRPHPDMPFAATMPNTAAVPKDKDTKTMYDNRPFASGPYRVDTYQRGQRLVLVKNTRWDPATDPVRHQYPDTIQFYFGASPLQINERIIADQGPDATTLTWQNVSLEILPKVLGDPALMARTIDGLTQYNWYININTQRVTDVDVRRALNWAIDRANFLKVYGPKSAEAGTTILSPTTAGYVEYNAYDGGPNGDLEKAKELLHGRSIPLVYAYPNSSRQQKVAAFLKTNLEQAGFKVSIEPVDGDQYYSTIGKKDNPYDLYLGGWGSDWPSGATVIPPLFDGRTIAPEGNQNLSYFNEPEVNARIDSIMVEPDLEKAAAAWAALDREIMERWAPVVPMLHSRTFSLVGSGLGGAYLSPIFGITALNEIYVKRP